MRGFQLGRETRRTAVATEVPAEGRIDSDSSGTGPPSNKNDSVLVCTQEKPLPIQLCMQKR